MHCCNTKLLIKRNFVFFCLRQTYRHWCPPLGMSMFREFFLNFYPAKKNLLAKSLEQNLVGSKIKRPFRKSFWVKKTSRARFCGLRGRSRPNEELGFEWPGLVPAPLQLSSEAPMDQKGEIKLLLIFEKAWVGLENGFEVFQRKSNFNEMRSIGTNQNQ